MKLNEIAIELADEAQGLSSKNITIIERSGIRAINMCGTVACLTEAKTTHGLPEIAALAVRDVFGATQLHHQSRSRFGIMVATHTRENRGDSLRPRQLERIEMGNALAALGFLEDCFDESSLRAPTEITELHAEKSFHHGTDNVTFSKRREGWRLNLNAKRFGEIAVDVLFAMNPIMSKAVSREVR